jgi:hypothetical protein
MQLSWELRRVLGTEAQASIRYDGAAFDITICPQCGGRLRVIAGGRHRILPIPPPLRRSSITSHGRHQAISRRCFQGKKGQKTTLQIFDFRELPGPIMTGRLTKRRMRPLNRICSVLVRMSGKTAKGFSSLNVTASSRARHYLLAAFASLLLLDATADEPIHEPTFGEQIREIVQAHHRGEITYDEMMQRRSTLSEQFGSGSAETPPADSVLRKPASVVPSAPVSGKPVPNCSGIRKLTLKCLRRPNPFKAKQMPVSTTQAVPPSQQTTDTQEKKPANVVPATPASGKPVLDCGGLRKFTPKCLRRPNPFKEK